MTASRVVIEARSVSKSFRIPDQRIDSVRERVTHPFTRAAYRELHALRGVSFDVHDGEFFGIVGRNGSGKSTLLKVLASIYGPDAGQVRAAGRIAPFIELGVGFNPERPARENVILNGVLMGLGRREARHRFDAVLDFAELRDFADLKLKNYSSGMMVRLAFAVMVQADAEILLIDEVLAVGDASFAAKCMDVFHERRRLGKTVVLVTHDMATVRELCHRAMLLHDGELEFIGDPEDAAVRYFRLNFGTEDPRSGQLRVPDYNVEVRAASVTAAEKLELDVELVARRAFPATGARVQLQLRTPDHVVVQAVDLDVPGPLVTGEAIRLRGAIEHKLVPGEYALDCWVHRPDQRDLAVQGLRLADFTVPGEPPSAGLVALPSDVTLERV